MLVTRKLMKEGWGNDSFWRGWETEGKLDPLPAPQF